MKSFSSIAIIVCIFIHLFPAHSQYWERTYDIDGQSDNALSVTSASDGKIIMAGDTFLNPTIPHCALAICTDLNGDILWAYTYEPEESFSSDFRSLIPLSDGFIFAGVTTIGHPSLVYLVRTNEYGDTVWTRMYGTEDELHQSGDIVPLWDDGFIGIWNNWSGEVLYRFNSDGDSLWARVYSISAFTKIIVTSDSGFVMSGSAYMVSVFSAATLTRTDSLGNILWFRTFTPGTANVFYSVVRIPDGGFIATGYTVDEIVGDPPPHRAFIVKVTEEGDTIWTHQYGNEHINILSSLVCTQNEEYVFAGYTGEGYDEYDVWLLCLNEDGDSLWARTYGDSADESANSIAIAPDGGFIIAGTKRYGTHESDIYLIKTDSLGNVDWISEIPQKPKDISLKISPNPFNSSCRISISDCLLPITGVEIFDISGRKVAQFPLNDGIDEIVWNASTQPSGIYFCRVCPHDALPPVKLLLMK